MPELIHQFFLSHDRSYYQSAFLLLAIVINLAAWYVCRHRNSQQHNLLLRKYMLPYFSVGITSACIDLVPSALSTDIAIYLQLLFYLFCTLMLLNSSIRWTRKVWFYVSLFLLLLLMFYQAQQSALALVLGLNMFTLCSFGALLLVYGVAYQRTKNIGYLFYTVAMLLICLGSLFSFFLALRGQLNPASEVLSAVTMTGFCLAGVGYILVLQYQEQHIIQRLATQDPLTELLNRRGMEEAFALKLRSGARHWAVAAVDIDHFKQVNDRYGHDVGDLVISQMAAAMRQTARSSDLLCRYGGEEFMLILFDSSAEAVWQIAERLRLVVQNTLIETDSGDIQITVSIGLAESSSELSLQECIKAADIALYQAKHQGRNRVVTDRVQN